VRPDGVSRGQRAPAFFCRGQCDTLPIVARAGGKRAVSKPVRRFQSYADRSLISFLLISTTPRGLFDGQAKADTGPGKKKIGSP